MRESVGDHVEQVVGHEVLGGSHPKDGEPDGMVVGGQEFLGAGEYDDPISGEGDDDGPAWAGEADALGVLDLVR